MRKAFWVVLTVMVIAVLSVGGCVLTQPIVSAEDGTGYPGVWEDATLQTDEFGTQLIVVRENEEEWVLEAKTYCFWTSNYVGKTVLLKWGPVESLLMNEAGEVCHFWTRKRLYSTSR